MDKKLRKGYCIGLICLLLFPTFVWSGESEAIEIATSKDSQQTTESLQETTATTALTAPLTAPSETLSQFQTEMTTDSETIESQDSKENTTATIDSDGSQKTEITSEDQKTVEKRQNRADETWTLVEDVTELITALNSNPPATHIKLAGPNIFALSKNVPVRRNVVIDGNGRSISNSSGGLSGGIYADATNIEVTFQNVTFGSSDYSVPMKNVYGLFPAADSEVVKLNLHNVNYYSNSSAQAFYLCATGSEIHFSGENEFLLADSGQEFAEAHTFYFEANSKTTVRHSTTSSEGFIYARTGTISTLNLAENAIFDVETNHAFIYNSAINDGNIIVRENAKLLIKSVAARSTTSKYPIAFDGGEWNINVTEKGLLDINYPESIRLGNNSHITIGKDATAVFKITENDSVFDRSVGSNSTFTIDNANLVKFTATASSNNPIGFVGGSNKFSFAEFIPREGEILGTEGYAIRTDPVYSIAPQKSAGTWNITNTNITREIVANTPSFTEEEQTAMKDATTIQIVKIPEPKAQISTLNKTENYSDFSVKLENYQLFNNTFDKVEYRLFTQEVTDPDDDTNLKDTYSATTIDEEATFSGLTENTTYWLYVKIICKKEAQSSDWFQDTVKTKALLNVEVPTYIGFQTNDKNEVISSGPYQIVNKGTSAVDIKVGSFKVTDNPSNIQLLDNNTDPDGLYLFLTGDNMSNIVLKNLEAPADTPLFGNIIAGETKKIDIDGQYNGNIDNITYLNSQLTLLIEESTSGGDI